MPPLETARLRIRPFTQGDLPAFAALTRAAFPGAPGDLAAYRDQVMYYALADGVQAELRQPPYGDRAVVLKETGTLIGAVGLVPCLAPFDQLPSRGGWADARFTPEVGLFWAIAPDHRRQGYATEAARALAEYAFGEMNVARLVATTEHDNAASIATMRRLGMTVERNAHSMPAWFQTVGTLAR